MELFVNSYSTTIIYQETLTNDDESNELVKFMQTASLQGISLSVEFPSPVCDNCISWTYLFTCV